MPGEVLGHLGPRRSRLPATVEKKNRRSGVISPAIRNDFDSRTLEADGLGSLKCPLGRDAHRTARPDRPVVNRGSTQRETRWGDGRLMNDPAR